MEKEKASKLLFAACWLVYMVVCLTKTNYVASIAFVVKEGIFTKSNAGIISAAFYLMYGISQVLGGNIVDRFSPYKIMSICVLGSVVTNLLLAFTNSFAAVLFLWGITGLIQFGVWPVGARIVTGILIPKHREKAGVYITLALGAGGILSYVLVAIVLEALGWCGVFLMNVIFLLVSLAFWKFVQKRTEKILMTEKADTLKLKVRGIPQKKFLPLFFSSGLFLIMFFGIAQAMLDNGVKSWVPTMMIEIYGVSAVWASMQNAIIYICNITGLFFIVYIFRNVKSPVTVQVLYFIICLPICMLMVFIGNIPLWSVFILLIISTTVTYAMTNISVRIASAFDKYGYSATVSGIINAFVCLGIVIGNGGYGIIAERFGWTAVTYVWLIVCVSTVALGIPSIFLWRKFMLSDDEICS